MREAGQIAWVGYLNQQFDQLSPEAQIVLRLVDAQRDVATIVRESGLAPADAVSTVAELLYAGIVEEWDGSDRVGEVAVTDGRLPEATGAIDFSSAAYFAASGSTSDPGEAEPPGDRGETDASVCESRTEN